MEIIVLVIDLAALAALLIGAGYHFGWVCGWKEGIEAGRRRAEENYDISKEV